MKNRTASIIVVALAGCTSAGPYHCSHHDECVLDGLRGSCINGRCAFLDKICISGLRYYNDPYAETTMKDKLDGTCVPCRVSADCLPLPHATPICSSLGKCLIGSCSSDHADCDGNPSNGCEANLSNDQRNCGSCGKSCLNVSGQTCASGTCTMNPSMTGQTTVIWTGTSAGNLCGSTNYGCTSNGTMGDRDFLSPVVGTPRGVLIILHLNACGMTGMNTMGVYLNNTLIDTVSLAYNCTFGACNTVTVSNTFPNGIPGFWRSSGLNTLHLVVVKGDFCGRDAIITITT